MFTSNLFADLTVFLTPIAMQIYIILMVLAVETGLGELIIGAPHKFNRAFLEEE